MPEPTSASTLTIVAASAAIPTLTAFGVPLGLRPDLLIAGFAGSLAAITLLNTVPSDTWSFGAVCWATLRRIMVAFASSLTAGYITPLAMLVANIPEPLLLGSAFVVGGGAHHVLAAMIRRFAPKEEQ